MKKIWILFFIEIGILAIFKPFIVDFEFISIFFVFTHSIISILFLLQYRTKIKYLFLIAFILRIFTMFWDIYFHNILKLPNSGADSEMYYYYAVQISRYESFGDFFTRGGLYSLLNGILFIFIGTQRMVGQYLNVLFGLNVVILVYEILNVLRIEEKIKFYTILLISIFPNSLIMSGIFLRESIITFLSTLSLYYFTLWFLNKKNRYIFFTILYVSLASIFHSGMISLFIGYSFGFLFYSHKDKKFIFSKNTIFAFLILTIFFVFTYFRYQNLFYSKFAKIDEITDYYKTLNSKLGGSAYLKFLKIDSPLMLVIFGPIKFLYFFVAPLPFEWRNLFDIITFFFDSSLYLIVLIQIIMFVFKNKRSNNLLYNNYIVCLIFVVLGVALIFGSGVGNTGTALRHRQKFIVNFILLFGLLNNYGGKVK